MTDTSDQWAIPHSTPMAAGAAGHVNMMDDVLISNLPPVLLRSALRTLVSQGAVTQRPFAQHIRKRLLEAPPPLTDARELFPPAPAPAPPPPESESSPGSESGSQGQGQGQGTTVVSQACLEYIASTRCVFSSKLAKEALSYLTHFVTSIPEAQARWTPGDALDQVFDKFSGDIVQAVQALKESKPNTTDGEGQQQEDPLLTSLKNLLAAFDRCADYCAPSSSSSLKYPFTRAERQVRDVVGFLYPDATIPSSSSRSLRPIEVDLLLSAQEKKRSQGGAAVETFRVGPFEMPRLFNGLWQLSSPAWGSGSAEAQEAALTQLVVEAGLSAADMADHYGDAELIYGDFRSRLPAEIRDTVYAATKWCIFGPLNQPVTSEFVLAGVKERCRRLGGRVELLQFHWYDYASKEYLDILLELVKITKTHPELVSAIGLCNFDGDHTEEVCQYILDKTGEVGIVSNQVQFSLLDARPLHRMIHVCEWYGVKLLTYGSFCGGFISPKWLGQPIPEIYSEASQLTPSQRKYFDMLQNWGTWAEFQTLLETLSDIAKKHGPGISLTNVATRWVLQQPAVGAVIVGTRLGVSSHAGDNLNVFKFQLDVDDMAAINKVALGEAPTWPKHKAVYDKLGDCGNEYRAMH